MMDIDDWLKKHPNYGYYYDDKYSRNKLVNGRDYLNCSDSRRKPLPIKVYVHLKLALVKALLKMPRPMTYEEYYRLYKKREEYTELDNFLNEKK